MKLPVDIDYDSVHAYSSEGIVFKIDNEELFVTHSSIITHDEEKKIIQVPESFAIRNNLI